MEINPVVVLIIISVLLIAFNYIVIRSVKLISEPEKIIEQVEYIDDDAFIEACQQISSWGESLGFQHETFFNFYGVIGGPPLLCSAWLSNEEKTRVIFSFAKQQSNIDLVTSYGKDLCVTTASTKDAMLLPYTPDMYIQAFTGLSLEDQYTMHIEARASIEVGLSVLPEIGDEDILQQMSTALKKQAAYIVSLPFWYARGLFWYFIQRNLKVNKPVKLSKT